MTGIDYREYARLHALGTLKELRAAFNALNRRGIVQKIDERIRDLEKGRFTYFRSPPLGAVWIEHEEPVYPSLSVFNNTFFKRVQYLHGRTVLHEDEGPYGGAEHIIVGAGGRLLVLKSDKTGGLPDIEHIGETNKEGVLAVLFPHPEEGHMGVVGFEEGIRPFSPYQIATNYLEVARGALREAHEIELPEKIAAHTFTSLVLRVKSPVVLRPGQLFRASEFSPFTVKNKNGRILVNGEDMGKHGVLLGVLNFTPVAVSLRFRPGQGVDAGLRPFGQIKNGEKRFLPHAIIVPHHEEGTFYILQLV